LRRSRRNVEETETEGNAERRESNFMKNTEHQYAIFGHNIGNLGPTQRQREPMTDTVRRLNGSLPEGTKVIAWFRHTGNFVLESDLPKLRVSMEFGRVLGSKCAVLSLESVQTLMKDVNVSAITRAGVRWTPGLAFKIESQAPKGRSLPTRAKLERLSEGVVFARKRDFLTPRNVLDRVKRLGGWGGVAQEASARFGGLWTARSLTSIRGLLARADATRSATRIGLPRGLPRGN
jgi:hypothetical protein